MSEEIISLMKLFLPSFLIDNFRITKVDQIASRINIYLEENPEIPPEIKSSNLISHGFHKQSTIKDFPIRIKQVYLYIRRHRWLNKQTNEVVSRDWDLAAKGTRMTNEFASFLKGLN